MSFLNIRAIKIIGNFFIMLLLNLGSALVFFIKSIYHCFIPPYYFNNLIKQIIEIGFLSFPIVGLTGILIGAVIVLQSNLSGPLIISQEQIIPKLVTITIIRDLGPVLISLIMVGKVGSSIAAEIGTMRITEQIDVLKTLNINAFKYLIAPRILASIIVFPVLIICADLIGIFGGYITAVFEFNYNLDLYIKYTTQFFNMNDFFIGLVKAIVFGSIISFSSCYHGYHCRESAKGIAIATTSTVVLSSILIILVNYIITLIYA